MNIFLWGFVVGAWFVGLFSFFLSRRREGKKTTVVPAIWTAVLLTLFVASPALASERKFGPELYALQLLSDRGETDLPIINVTDTEKYPEAKGMVAFVIRKDDRCQPREVLLVRTSGTYLLAKGGSHVGLLLLASAILHEWSHCRGTDEAQALSVEVEWLRKQLLDLPPEERNFLGAQVAFLNRLRREAASRLVSR